MLVRKRSFSLFVKLVQNLINQISNNEGWAKTEEVLKSLESAEIDFNPSNYGFVTTLDAFSSIHGGWLEFKKTKNADYVKVNKIMP
ncbi:OST-HTH/LOTUS domain-containing protein [Acinetobacter sp. YH16032]|uniref:OST-HTH/LOTUS domain-containing protein n=1 Tax=unclassified Acinetobacter TaxID=196816 RepID=UPI0035A12321